MAGLWWISWTCNPTKSPQDSSFDSSFGHWLVTENPLSSILAEVGSQNHLALVGGWTNPFEKCACQSWTIFPEGSGWKEKNICNHHLVHLHCFDLKFCQADQDPLTWWHWWSLPPSTPVLATKTRRQLWAPHGGSSKPTVGWVGWVVEFGYTCPHSGCINFKKSWQKQNLLIIWRAYDSDTLQYSIRKWQGHSKIWLVPHDFIQTLNHHLHLVHFATLIVAWRKIAWLSYGHGEKRPNVGKFNFGAGKKSLPIIRLLIGQAMRFV